MASQNWISQNFFWVSGICICQFQFTIVQVLIQILGTIDRAGLLLGMRAALMDLVSHDGNLCVNDVLFSLLRCLVSMND